MDGGARRFQMILDDDGAWVAICACECESSRFVVSTRRVAGASLKRSCCLK